MILVDTSGLFAVLDADDRNHALASRYWRSATAESLITHGYVVAETVSLVRTRMGWPAVDSLVDELMPRVRIEMIDRGLHDEALAEYRSVRGGTSFVDRVTIAFARRHRIREAFAFDRNLVAAGLRFPGKETA